MLKPGGRFAVSDVVIRGEMPPEIRRSLELWAGCVAGALQDEEYIAGLNAAGFIDVEVERWRTYQIDDARALLGESGLNVDQIASQIEGRLASAFIRARKPERSACCGPGCCAS